MKTVLLIEEEVELLALLRYNLEKEGYRVVAGERRNYGGGVLRSERLDMVILDTAALGPDGLEDCRALRSRPELGQIPFALLVGCRSEMVRFAGQQLRVSEYIVKPFFVRDLISCIARQLQQKAQPVGELRFGPLELDRSTGRVTVNGIARSITATEFRLLEFLMSRPGVVFTREQLLFSVWGHNRSLTAGNVAAFIKGLRKKIEHDPAKPVFIRSVRGFGYAFNEMVGDSVQAGGDSNVWSKCTD